MDRGRVGYNASGNKKMREDTIRHMRGQHLARLKKIQNRPPGTSHTLDNTAPHVIPALKSNPRKIGKARELNVMIERENKSLLKRISKILTAPPKIDDEEYFRMKALCPSMRGPKQIYEEQIIMKHHKQLMKHLKSTGPFYDRKKWEESYKSQKIHQRFMRDVTYERPPGFVDPLADTSKPRNYEKERREIIERRKMAKSISGPPGAQVKRLQNVRDSKDPSVRLSQVSSPSAAGGRSRLNSAGGGRSSFGHSGPGASLGSFESAGEWGGMWANDSEYAGEGFDSAPSSGDQQGSGHGTHSGIELARIERTVRVDDDNEEFNGSTYETMSIAKCTVVEQDSLLIMVQSIQEPSMSSIAEVTMGQIAELKGLDEEALRKDADKLSELSLELLNSVEFKIQGGVPRLQLNLIAPEPTPRPPLPEYDAEAEQDVLSKTREVEPPFSATVQVKTEFKTKEMFESDTCPKPRAEKLMMDVTVERRSEDTAMITATLRSASKFQFGRGSAVESGSTLKQLIYLPSIARADLDLAREFYENVVDDLKVEHNNVSGTNSLVVPEGAVATEDDLKKRR